MNRPDRDEADTSLPRNVVKAIQQVHDGLRLKRDTEFQALSLRFEPAQPLRGSDPNKRPSSDLIQAYHVLRRLDESLCYWRGFQYNPCDAHFDRDPCGTGLLQFEDGTSLLGTHWIQDRWRHTVTPLPILSHQERLRAVQQSFPVSRGARVDAFLAMFQQRQALTWVAGMAPLCFFVGQQFDLTSRSSAGARLPGLRLAPRAPNRRIQVYRWPRLCMHVVLDGEDRGGGENSSNDSVHAIALLERQEPHRGDDENLRFTAYLIASGPSVTRDPKGTETRWHEQLQVAFVNQWTSLFQGRGAFRVFDKPWHQRAPPVVEMADAVQQPWSTACTLGDEEMLYRVGLLLESPDLSYAPWIGGFAVGSLARILRAIPPPSDPHTPLIYETWMQSVLLSRMYPYTLIANQDMSQRKGYKPYAQDMDLTEKDIQLYRDSLLPLADTVWYRPLQTVNKARTERTRQRKKEQQQRKQEQRHKETPTTTTSELPPTPPSPTLTNDPMQVSDLDIDPLEHDLGIGQDTPPHLHDDHDDVANTMVIRNTDDPVVFAGVNGGGRRGGRRGRGRGTNIEIQRVELETPKTKIEPYIYGPRPQMIHRISDAVEARFLSRRLAFDAVNRLDPLYVVVGGIWKPSESYHNAYTWRNALIMDDMLLWRIGLETLELLYPNGSESIWNAGESTTEHKVTFPRAHWARRLEKAAPRYPSREYAALRNKDLKEPMFVPPTEWKRVRSDPVARGKAKALDQERRDKLLDSLPGLAARGRNILMKIGRGTAPPEKAANQADLQIFALAAGMSLIREGVISFIPPTRTWNVDEQDRTLPKSPLELEFEARLPLLWQPESEKATFRALGTFALLAWEWGSVPGLERYLAWLDHLAQQRNQAPVSKRLTATYPVFQDLLGTPVAATVAPVPQPLPTPQPVILTPPSSTQPSTPPSQLANLVAYVEELHGYGPGELARQFQGPADQMARGGTRPAADVEVGNVRFRIDGIRYPPLSSSSQQLPPWIWVGWSADKVARSPSSGIKVSYTRTSGNNNNNSSSSSGAKVIPPRIVHTPPPRVRRNSPIPKPVPVVPTPIEEDANIDYDSDTESVIDWLRSPEHDDA